MFRNHSEQVKVIVEMLHMFSSHADAMILIWISAARTIQDLAQIVASLVQQGSARSLSSN